MSIFEKLNQIQTKLKAPKNQRNTFGNYNYRSCEDILEGLKPLLKDLKCSIVISDEIVVHGDRHYIEATATLIDSEKDENNKVSAKGFAREPVNKKGMDESQITGSSSSYARKYALNGLFAIDDTKDADTRDNTGAKDDESDKPKGADSNNNGKKSNTSKSNEQIINQTNNCSICGAEVNDAVRAYSNNNFGQTLCREHQKAENKIK